jgi:hypothetical protein
MKKNAIARLLLTSTTLAVFTAGLAQPARAYYVYLNSNPSVVYQSKMDRVHAFVVGTDKHLYDDFYNNSTAKWTWEDMRTPSSAGVSSAPSAVYQTSLDRVHAFVVGTNGHLYDDFYNNTAWSWVDMGTPSPSVALSLTTAPSAVYQTSLDRVHAFVVGTNGELYDDSYNSTSKWTWQAIGAVGSQPPSAVYQSKINEVDVWSTMDVGASMREYATYANTSAYLPDSWFFQYSGYPIGTPQVLLNASAPSSVYQTSLGRVHTFVVGNTGHLYLNYYNNDGPVSWLDMGTPPGVPVFGAPSAVYQTSLDRVAAFVRGYGGDLYADYYNAATGLWTWVDIGSPTMNNIIP